MANNRQEPIEVLSRHWPEVLFVAPHPDDETLAAGGLLLRLISAGSRVRVLFLTDGERNPLAHSALERRFCFGTTDRERFRALRRTEASAALKRLGIDGNDCLFLSLPDSHVARSAARNPGNVIDRLRAVIQAADPDLILLPCRGDLHPDHRAASGLIEASMAGMGRPAATLRYAVHRSSGIRPRGVTLFRLSSQELHRKQAAIDEYKSQLILSRRRFISFAQESEEFHGSCDTEPEVAGWSRAVLRLWTIIRGAFRRPVPIGAPLGIRLEDQETLQESR